MASPTQPQVIDEVWDDERVKGFLAIQPHGDVSADFYRLNRAYQGMRAADFKRFLTYFVDAGGDLDTRDQQGRTIAEVIARHRNGAAYLEAIAQVT